MRSVPWKYARISRFQIGCRGGVTHKNESGDDGSSSGSEVSIGEEADEANRLTAESDDSDEEETESSGDDEESSESDSSNSGDDSSSEESGSSDSLWGALDDDVNKETQEANEASALQEFQSALDYLVEGKSATASKILNRLLNNPLVKVFRTEVFDWETEIDERLSKMARLYVGIHKNLAKLKTGNAVEHFLQILSIAPKNPEIWLKLGANCLAKGDVDFAKFAFEHAEGNVAVDALLSALYLSRNYHACLRLAHKCLDMGICEKKSLFLKELIRSVNCHFSDFCDNVFGEHRRYDKVKTLDEKTRKKMADRLAELEEKINAIQNETSSAVPDPIEITVDAEQTVADIGALFCDLFDRIEAYSSLSLQQVTFIQWDDRRILLEAQSVLESVFDIIETVEYLLNQTASHTGRLRQRSNSLFEASDCFVRRSMRKAMEIPLEEEDTAEEPAADIRHLDGTLPAVELASCLGFAVKYIQPLKEILMKRPSRTPSPELSSKYIDTDLLLFLLMTSVKEGSWTMFELFEIFLCLIADFSPACGAIPSSLLEVVAQCYRRFNLLSTDLCHEKYIRLHVLMDELGEVQARDYCIQWHCAEKWDDKELLQRFMWNHAKVITDDTIKLSFLKCLHSSLEEDEFIFTAKGWFGKDDVQDMIDKLEKSNRIISLSQLRSCSRFEEVISIITRDVDFNTLEDEDLYVMVDYLLDAYNKVKNHDSAVEFASRVFQLYLSYKQLPTDRLNATFRAIENTCWSKVADKNCEKIGYFLCRLLSIEEFRVNWNIWKVLYEIVRHLRGDVSVAYIKTLDPVKNDECMPSLALDVLVKAHEKLGEAKVCGREKGAFLLFYMRQLHKCITNMDVMTVMQQDEYAWLWSNVSEEIAQCLYCSFGRYSKRRRALEDHDCNVSCSEVPNIMTMTLELAMPHPLPQYDDKERLGHDIVDLILNKFPSALNYSNERGQMLHNFNLWMRQASKENAKNRLEWPSVKGESYVQASIWYLMALHHYRQGNHEEIEKFAKLFLTSGHATLDSRVTAGAWAVLGYSSVYRIFQMDDDLLYLEWPWHVLPFKVSVLVDSRIGVVFFQLANTLYQVATRLSRYFLTLPSDDWRLRHADTLLKDLRLRSLSLFKEALSKAQGDSSICEYQWLAYFFIAKLQAKLNGDVIRVVDAFYEAACSCELSEFFYPIKINVKKQQNIEPVELHYQIHSTVWKFLCKAPSPSLEILVTLLAYLRAVQNHKVVRSYFSLFSIHPDIYATIIDMTLKCDVRRNDDDVTTVVNDIANRADLIDEIWNLCHRGFEVVCDRFPHMKSYYRLAEMELSRGNVEIAYNHLTRHIFRRKKRDESLFDSVVEITSQDIDRSGSFPYHVERALELMMSLAYQLKDASILIGIITTLIANMESRSEMYILKERQGALLVHAANRLHILVMESSSPKVMRSEMYRAWQVVNRRCCISMDCIVAAATGALKGINLRENSFTNLLPIKNLTPKQDEITSMVWSGTKQSDVLAALLDRSLKLYDTQTNSFDAKFSISGGEGAVQGLHCLENGKIASCVESGMVNVWSESGESCKDWEAGEGVKVMRGSSTRNELLTGGIKHLIKTWDIETGKRVWSARNVPLDFLGLEVPIMCTDARFMDDSGTILEATKLHEMRLYDPRAQRRPVKKIPFMDVPITAVSRCYKDNHVLAANSIGEMGLFDLRSKIHPVCKYKGQAGAIRSIDAHPTAPYVATCGIDRFVRVHDIDTKKLAHKIYCKTRLNRVLITSELPSLLTVLEGNDEQEWEELKKEMNCDSDSAEGSSDDGASADEEIWEKLDVSGDSSVKSRRSRILQRKRKEDEELAEANGDDEEPASKKKKVRKPKKRKENNADEVNEEKRKKAKIVQGIKRHDEIKEEVDSDEEPPKRMRKIGKAVVCSS
ncbi:unnamed protein product [Cylicocyclus nassatus]|uniref:Uncharacterized protein n=1 Tax=Cylicocyclus nassatus TaxID=53992 RepID=A0AA36DQ70_CYLNA|nr:unnamed protein product [Cylicocyclus nassatus]